MARDFIRMQKEDQIIQRAKAELSDEAYDALIIDRHYGSPESFWSSAKHHGLTTEEDYRAAMRSYGDLWYYRGD